MIPTLLTDSISPDLERSVHYTLLWGLEAVELRRVGGALDRVPHVNEQLVRGRLVESEMPVLAISPGMFEGAFEDRSTWLNELAAFEETTRFCRRIDCGRIVVSSFFGSEASERGRDEAVPSIADRQVQPFSPIESIADPFRRAAVQAHKNGIQLCVSNRADGLVRTGEQLASLLVAVDHPGVTGAWDPLEALIAGENPLDGLSALEDRVGHVRCSNARRKGNGWEARSIDSGAVDWADQIERLYRIGFSGAISLDVRVEPKAKSGLREATELIKLLRTHR